MDYTAIGTVTNLAARLCGAAKDGQILVSRRVAIAIEDAVALEEIGDLALKGMSQALAVYNVLAVGAQPSASRSLVRYAAKIPAALKWGCVSASPIWCRRPARMSAPSRPDRPVARP